MKYLILCLTLSLSAAFGITPPTGLTATWSEGSGSHRTITLNWADNASDETTYMVERKVGTAAWADLTTVLAADTQTYIDAAVPRAPSALTVYYYRVRARVGTVESAPAEVVTAGIPSTGVYDTDADGIDDVDEAATNFLSSTNWADGSADHDGDGIPNAWEINLGTDMKSSASFPVATANAIPVVTVDPSAQAQTANVTWTIKAALAKIASGTTHPNNSYRIIRVKPGIYRENITKSNNNNVALIPLRTGSASDHFEIQGVDATDPVITVTTGGFVIDGFIISRAAGTRGPALTVNEEVSPTNRISRVRMVNCLISNIDSGTSSLVVQSRSRLVLSHCTFYMNAADTGALAHSYSTGLAGATTLPETARLQVHNCVFWNPVNTLVPEFQSAGQYQFTSSIVYQSSAGGLPPIPAGCDHVNPVLTPRGYLAGVNSPAFNGGTANVGVVKDMHGEDRFDPASRGADEWHDGDGDGIPDFADSMPASIANADLDGDYDGLSDLGEYLGSTSIYGADSPYLTLNQAYSLFMPQTGLANGEFFTKDETYNLFYTKTESHNTFFSKTLSDARYLTLTDAAAQFLTTTDLAAIQADIDDQIDADELATALTNLPPGQGGSNYLSKDPQIGMAYGTGSVASAPSSSAMGEHVEANMTGQIVVGRYNQVEAASNPPSQDDPVFVVGIGNGIPEDEAERKNAVVVKRNGDVNITGGVLRVMPAGDLSMLGFEEGPRPVPSPEEN